MRRSPLVACLGLTLPLLALSAAWASGPAPSVCDTDWPYYNGDPGGSHYSRLDQINTSNVAQLAVAWTYDSGDAISGDLFSASDMELNPLVVDGRMWMVSPKGCLICLDAETGRELWTFNPSPELVSSKQRLRGVSFWTDGRARRILFTYGHELISVDAGTGRPDLAFGTEGRVDLRKGFGRPVDQVTAANVSPGAVYRDLIIMGSTGQLPGDVRAFDVRTGKIRWSFHTIPHPGEPGYETWPKDAWKHENGANVWAGLTVDTASGLVFLPTASIGMGMRVFYGAGRKGANRFADSLIALDAVTGRRRWDFQTVHHDLWDRDLPTPPTLVTVRRGGKAIPAIAQATKSGFVYILDRHTGVPLFPVRETRVAASDVPGETAWPTQPIPVMPAPFARQRLTPDILTTRTPQAHDAVAAQFAKVRSAGQFVPPSLQGSIIFPGLDGGAEWGGQAYDPETGLLYINANEMAWTLTLKPRPKPVAGNGGAALYAQNCAACHGDNREGSPPTVPALTSAGRLGHAAIVRQVTMGSGRMPGFGGALPAGDIDRLALWLEHGDAAAAPPLMAVSGRGELAASLAGTQQQDAYVFDGYKRFLDPDGYPAVKPPWGTLSALDVSTGRYVWKIPFGEYPELAAQGLRNTGSENYGGGVVTGGGLLFIGATSFDRKFHAYDKRSGALLWETVLPAAGSATPATYAAHGRQFVVIAAGGGKDVKGPVSGKIVAFALPHQDKQ